MNFDRFLENFDSDSGQKEQIALIIYYFEQHEGFDDVTQADIKGVIRGSRSTINTSTVSQYISRLRDNNWITSTENDGYRLSNPGRQGVRELLDEAAIVDHRDEDERFVDTDVVDDERYDVLIEDINDCYRYRIYDGMMVLTRKLFEDMVFQILKTHYAGKQNDMFYHQANGQHYSFDDLLTNLKDGIPTLRMYSRELDQSLVEEIRDLKEEGNSGAHSIRLDFSDEEVDDWSDDATRFTEILYEVLSGARIADQQND
jgi:DNA-binding PadR family transcriptional regulator